MQKQKHLFNYCKLNMYNQTGNQKYIYALKKVSFAF